MTETHSTISNALGIEELYERAYPSIYRFVRARVQEPADAEDIASQAFLQALGHYDASRSDSEAIAWLFQITRNVMGDHWRKHYRGVSTTPLTDVIMETYTAEDVTLENPKAEVKVDRTLSALPGRYRKVLELRFLQGASLQETATNLETSVANAKVLQHRALRKAAMMTKEVDRYEPCENRAA